MELNRLTSPRGVDDLARKLDAIHIGHELVMTDNVYGVSHYPDEARSIFLYPAKIVGAVILMCASGSISLKINLSSHTAVESEVIVILPGSIIQVEGAKGDLKFASISFASRFYENIVDVSPQMRETPVIRLSNPDFQECIEIYHNLKNRIEKSDVRLSNSVAEGYLKVLCGIIFDYWYKNSATNQQHLSLRSLLYRKYLTKVQQDYHEHRSLKHYADCLSVTPKYLSKVVKLVSGRNASEFIDELVVFESKSLLMDKRYSIQQVANMMNFTNQSFFAKFFKQQCGITPSAYRNLNNK